MRLTTFQAPCVDNLKIRKIQHDASIKYFFLEFEILTVPVLLRYAFCSLLILKYFSHNFIIATPN